MIVQESTSRPVDGDTAWLSCHRKISGLESSSAASHTSRSFSRTERQRSTLRAFGWVEEVAAWKRSMPKAHSVKEVMPRDTACRDEDGHCLKDHCPQQSNDEFKGSKTVIQFDWGVINHRVMP